jgi:hypothetical protein
MDTTNTATGVRVDALAPAANNMDLWTVYLRGQVRNWIDPFRIGEPTAVDAVARPIADIAAAAFSGWTSLFAGPAVRLMYETNKPQVNQFVSEQAVDPESVEIPSEFASPTPAPLPFTQVEEWAITSIGAAPVQTREPALV